MNYREARLLKSGDEIARAWDKVPLVIHETTAFGQYKKVKLVCYLKGDDTKAKQYYYNDDVEVPNV
jgi:hypothetical protein